MERDAGVERKEMGGRVERTEKKNKLKGVRT